MMIAAQIILHGTLASGDIKLLETGGGSGYVGFDAPASVTTKVDHSAL